MGAGHRPRCSHPPVSPRSPPVCPVLRGLVDNFASCTVANGNVTSCRCNEPTFVPRETPSRFYCLRTCEAVRGTNGSTICDRTVANSTCTPTCPVGARTASTFTCSSQGEWDVFPYCREPLCSVCTCTHGRASCGSTVTTQPYVDDSAIQLLDIRYSPFQRLFPFADLPGLTSLTFESSSFIVIPSGVIVALGNLTFLAVRESLVATIEPEAFRGLSSLRELELVDLYFVSLPQGVFDDLTALVALSLHHSALKTSLPTLSSLPDGAFKSLTRLQILSLTGQSTLGVILDGWNQSNWEHFTQSLLHLNLNMHRFRNWVIPEFVFRFPNLVSLDLRNILVNRIPPGTFSPLKNLERLDLAFNAISTIHRDVFASIPTLTHLDMLGNDANCFLLPNKTVSCECDTKVARAVNGSCLSWCPDIATLGLHVTQGPVTNAAYCDVAGPGGKCQLACEPAFCALEGPSSTATCGVDGLWRTDMVCGPRPDCKVPVVDTQTKDEDSSAPANSNVVVIAAPLASIGLLVGLVVGLVLLRRQIQRRRANLAVRMELRSVIAQCVQTAFLRDYGHAVHDLRDQTVSFEALEVPVTAVRRERVIGRGESGEVWLSALTGVQAVQVSALATTAMAPSSPRPSVKAAAMSAHARHGPLAVAVKLCERTDAEAQVQVLLEAHVLHLLRHAHIVSLAAVVSSQVPVLVCTEYMAGGDLKTFLRACRPSNETVKVVLGGEDFDRMATQVCSALAFLEEKRILHRDVAARNVLVNADGSVVKLSDLGAARDVYRTEEYIKSNSSSARLPIAWMAPESLRDNVYTHKSDVWSFGVFLWELTSFARTPYGALGPREIAAEVAAGNRLAQPAACTTAMYATMKACWAATAVDRPSFADVSMARQRRTSANDDRAVGHDADGFVITSAESSMATPAVLLLDGHDQQASTRGSCMHAKESECDMCDLCESLESALSCCAVGCSGAERSGCSRNGGAHILRSLSRWHHEFSQ